MSFWGVSLADRHFHVIFGVLVMREAFAPITGARDLATTLINFFVKEIGHNALIWPFCDYENIGKT